MSISPRKKENCNSSGTFFRLRFFKPLPWVWPFFGCFWIFRFLTCMWCKQLSVWNSSHPGQFWPAPASDTRGSLLSGHTMACSALTTVYDPSCMLICTPNGGRVGRQGWGSWPAAAEPPPTAGAHTSRIVARTALLLAVWSRPSNLLLTLSIHFHHLWASSFSPLFWLLLFTLEICVSFLHLHLSSPIHPLLLWNTTCHGNAIYEYVILASSLISLFSHCPQNRGIYSTIAVNWPLKDELTT